MGNADRPLPGTIAPGGAYALSLRPPPRAPAGDRIHKRVTVAARVGNTACLYWSGLTRVRRV
ncbi:hypothetical protein GCM10009610_72040 [Pseudonocardia xinjiangensis]